MNRFVCLLLLLPIFLLSACSMTTADVNGTWEEVEGSDNGAFVIMTLSQAGTTVTGSVFAGLVGANVRGEISGNSFTFNSLDPFPPESTMLVTGQVNGSTMTGTASYAHPDFGPDTVSFTLQKTR